MGFRCLAGRGWLWDYGQRRHGTNDTHGKFGMELCSVSTLVVGLSCTISMTVAAIYVQSRTTKKDHRQVPPLHIYPPVCQQLLCALSYEIHTGIYLYAHSKICLSVAMQQHPSKKDLTIQSPSSADYSSNYLSCSFKYVSNYSVLLPPPLSLD